MLIKKIVELTKIWKCLQLLDLNVTSLNVISLVLEISGRCYMLYYCQYSIWRIIIIINPFKDPSFIVIDWSLLSTIIITTITIYYYYYHHHRHLRRSFFDRHRLSPTTSLPTPLLQSLLQNRNLFRVVPERVVPDKMLRCISNVSTLEGG